MSTNCTNFDGFLSPSSKRFRPEMDSPSCGSSSEESISSFVGPFTMPNVYSTLLKSRQVDSSQDYVVCSDSLDSSAAKRRRLLGSPQYATAVGKCPSTATIQTTACSLSFLFFGTEPLYCSCSILLRFAHAHRPAC